MLLRRSGKRCRLAEVLPSDGKQGFRLAGGGGEANGVPTHDFADARNGYARDLTRDVLSRTCREQELVIFAAMERELQPFRAS